MTNLIIIITTAIIASLLIYSYCRFKDSKIPKLPVIGRKEKGNEK